MKVSAPFESSFSQYAQFQMLTLVVWASLLVLGVASWTQWKHTHDLDRPPITLPLVHLLPWACGVIERKTVMKHHEVTDLSLQDGDPKQAGLPCLQSLIRVLWGAYFALFGVEITLLWH